MQDMENAKKHLMEHQTYPATKQELVDSCKQLSDFSPEDKEWFAEKLPDGTYNSAGEVMKALGMESPRMMA